MKSLYSYSSYRNYLQDRYTQIKAQDSTFSYQKFSKMANLNSPNYLKLIIDGIRDLTVANIHIFSNALKLTEAEAEFFEALVLANQASNALESKYYKSKVSKLKTSRIQKQDKIKIKNLSQNPYLPAILVSSNGLNEEDVAEAIAKKFTLPINQVQQVLTKLYEEKILIIENGKLKLSMDYFIQYDSQKSNIDQKNFLKAQLELSGVALENRYSVDAQFFAHTFTTKSDRIPDMIARTAKLLEEFTNESNDDIAENTLQINIQLFPLETLHKNYRSLSGSSI
jgi:uncharacterized protein (TIGR02147 family)